MKKKILLLFIWSNPLNEYNILLMSYSISPNNFVLPKYPLGSINQILLFLSNNIFDKCGSP